MLFEQILISRQTCRNEVAIVNFIVIVNIHYSANARDGALFKLTGRQIFNLGHDRHAVNVACFSGVKLPEHLTQVLNILVWHN